MQTVAMGKNAPIFFAEGRMRSLSLGHFLLHSFALYRARLQRG